MPAFSEFWRSPGVPRDHQKLLWDYLSAHDEERSAAIRKAVSARVREQEVTFNILGAPDGSRRPWILDEAPLVLDPLEFDRLAAKLTQRARVLELALRDLYGPRRLLKEGTLPAQLVLGNPRYFRACHQSAPLGDAFLVLYAADVGRAPDGEFRVFSDRTASPTGSGYALENRLVIGRILAEPFQSYRVRKINGFFETVSRALSQIAPARDGTPRLALLTPGLYDESSFEHAYLARYLGFDLVEGRDLTVRGNELFLKTLEGLKRVHGVLRRVPDEYCDPLELREDSSLGIPGLLGASRARTVGLLNPIGSGLAESPAFKAYLPAMCRMLLGEELKLASVETHYLGERESQRLVLDSLEEFVVKPAFREGRAEIARSLSKNALERLRKQIVAAPDQWLAERWPEQSTMPLGLRQEGEATMSLRLFACRFGEDYSVMPGGLARANDTPDGLFLTAESRSVSRDVWVPSLEEGVAPQLPRMPVQRLEFRRGGIDLPSRLFDDIFWLGRYVERCDNTARLLRAATEPLTSEIVDLPEAVVKALLEALHTLEILPRAEVRENTPEQLWLAAIYDEEKPNSLAATLSRIRFLTTQVRSRLSKDAWSVLRRLGSQLSREQGQRTLVEASEDMRELILVLAAFHGIVGSNMVRGHAWMFLEMGRRIERGAFVLTLLSHLAPSSGNRAAMVTLLNICDSLLTYRSRYLSTLQAAPVVDLVLTDDTNPQAVAFQVKRLLECVRALPKGQPFPLSPAEQHLVALQTKLVTTDLESATSGEGDALANLVDEGLKLLLCVSDDLTQSYFSHAAPSRAMAILPWIDENLEAN